MKDLTSLNRVCRENGIKFIYGWTSGVIGCMFSDFGHSHIVSDPDGEPTRMNIVRSISKTGVCFPLCCLRRPVMNRSHSGVVSVAGNRHRLDDDDHVKFEELEESLSRLHLAYYRLPCPHV